MGKVIEIFNEQIENWSRMDGFNANEIKVQEMEHQANLEIQDKTTRIKEKRADFSSFLDMVVLNVEEGWVNPLIAYSEMENIKKKLDSSSKKVKQGAINEAQQYGKTFDFNGFVIENFNGRKTFDYSQCQEIVELEAKLKARKEFYKKAKIAADAGGWSDIETLPDGSTRQVFQDENNELLVAPIIKYSAEYITLKQSKNRS
jgi:hypothetical protein|tara:strand:- start:996 stop:1601 length:606 start_codon:yes stop_codon:yes gene_type:complete